MTTHQRSSKSASGTDDAAAELGEDVDLDSLLPGAASPSDGEHTVVDASVLADRGGEPPVPGTTSGTHRSQVGASLDALGPAFPDGDSWSSVGSVGDSVVEDGGLGSGSVDDGAGDEADDAPGHGTVATRILEEADVVEEGNTSASPLGPAMPNAGTLRPHHEPAPADDAWAELEDRSASGWHSLTGESQVALTSEPTGQIEEADGESRVFAAGRAVELEEVKARLVGISGADAGREFPLLEREVSIGRTAGNTIALNDASVSRDHARLLRDGERYFLVDQRSGNGTFVNGERVSRARVRSGDEIGFGNALFRFIESDDAFRALDGSAAPSRGGARSGLIARLRASPYGRSLGISFGIVTASLLVAAIIAVVRGGGDAKEHARRDVIFQYYLEGVESFKRRDWRVAENKFSILLGLDPTYARGLRYVDAITREKRFGEQWEQAVASRQRGDVRQAYAIASALLDSAYADDAQALLDAIDTELEGQLLRARQALDAGRIDEALNVLTSIELARPGRPDVAALRDRAMQQTAAGTHAGDRESQAAATEDRPQDEAVGAADSDEGGDEDASADRVRAGRGGGGVTGRAQQLFVQGQLSDALAQLRQASGRDARVLQAKLQKFDKTFDAALEQVRSKRADAAIKLLLQARGLESKIAGGRSAYAGQIVQRLADMYYVQGMGQLFSTQLPEAFQSFREAVKFVPGHDKSERRLADLEQKAEGLVAEAESLQSRDPAAAKAKLRTATQIVAPSRPVYRRAKQRLDALR